MDEWKSLGQIGGAVAAYAILTKVFDFVREVKGKDGSGLTDRLVREIDKKTDRILRAVHRLEDRLALKSKDSEDEE